MANNRRKNKADMTITEQLHSIRDYACEICKYKEAYESGNLEYPETTTGLDYLIEHYCEKCRMMEV